MKMKFLLVKIVFAIFYIVPVNAASVYAIGNSLTYDTLPDYLEGFEGHHIGCSKNLVQIYNNPKNSACVPSDIGTWDKALHEKQFDFVTVQPHSGTTLEQDLAIINQWMKVQPSATFVIHTGWSEHKNFEANTHDIGKERVKSKAYYSTLMNRLAQENPERNIVSTKAINVLDSIYHDIENGTAPFASFDELYRDNIHMSLIGRYLMHNLMRQTLNQPMSNPIRLESERMKSYLDSKILEHKMEKTFPTHFFIVLGLLTITLGILLGINWQRQHE